MLCGGLKAVPNGKRPTPQEEPSIVGMTKRREIFREQEKIEQNEASIQEDYRPSRWIAATDAVVTPR